MAIVLGVVASGTLGVGMCLVRDSIVGSVVDSHCHAWLYTAPYAGAASLAGVLLCVRAIRRNRGVLAYALFALAWNALPLAVFILSLADRRF